ncbi:hypothetical protein [Sediminimonas qiaohouensis]|nr:hypothetical protein [Sediminimonas qiaohouensis]
MQVDLRELVEHLVEQAGVVEAFELIGEQELLEKESRTLDENRVM